MTFTVVIPARYASTRLPGKPLLDIAGKPMIRHVYERATESGAARIVIATDDVRIVDAVKAFGGEVCMTSASHQSGTDRLAEVAQRCDFDVQAIVVNLQGDEPFMPAENIRLVAENLARHPAASMATACAPIAEADELFNPNIVKVVRDRHNMAVYFSRAPIPWDRDGFANAPRVALDRQCHYRHIGLYAYRVNYLQHFTRMSPCELELTESLEQLRVLWNGDKIHVAVLDRVPPAGVDTPQDLQRARDYASSAVRGVQSPG